MWITVVDISGAEWDVNFSNVYHMVVCQGVICICTGSNMIHADIKERERIRKILDVKQGE